MDPHERIAELETEVAWLWNELRLTDDERRLIIIRDAFGVERGPAAILLRLYRARGEVVTHTSLLHAASPNPSDVSENVAKVQVHYLRQAIGKTAVETIWGQGYRLTPEGITLVRSVLEPKAEAAA